MKYKKFRSGLKILFGGCLFFLFVAIQPVCAETKYVSDILILTLREGPGDEFKVTRTLRTGMRLKILEEQERYYKVRTDSGEEGWVASRYLTEEIPKSIIIARLNEDIQALEKKIEKIELGRSKLSDRLSSSNNDLLQQIQELEASKDKYKTEATTTRKKLLEIAKKYDTLVANSKDVLSLTDERDGLLEDNRTLKGENQELIKKAAELGGENQRLMRNEILHWFLAGSGVFFIGLIVGKISRRKNRY